jgi:hypothetical protein
MKARQLQAHRQWQTVALYGESGVGKTSLAATAPSPIFLDSNKGLLSIAERKGFEHVRSVDVSSIGDLNAAYANFTGEGDEDWQKKFKTIVFDHFDDIQGIILDEIVEKGMERDERRDDTVEQREYGILFNKLARFLRKFKRVPCHKILICGYKEDFETGKLRPSLVGQMAQKLPYFVDHTLFVRASEKTGTRYIHLDPSEDFYAKTRAHWLTKEQRKVKVNFNNVTTLSELFAVFAAGPHPSKEK